MCLFLFLQPILLKVSLELKLKRQKDTEVKEEPVKIFELKNIIVKEEKAESLKELSNKLDNIEQKADEVYEKVKKKKDKLKKKKK